MLKKEKPYILEYIWLLSNNYEASNKTFKLIYSIIKSSDYHWKSVAEIRTEVYKFAREFNEIIWGSVSLNKNNLLLELQNNSAKNRQDLNNIKSILETFNSIPYIALEVILLNIRYQFTYSEIAYILKTPKANIDKTLFENLDLISKKTKINQLEIIQLLAKLKATSPKLKSNLFKLNYRSIRSWYPY